MTQSAKSNPSNPKTTRQAPETRPGLQERPPHKPWLSIIIPAQNEAALIGHTVRRAREAMGSQVIVVDGQSQDETVAIAKSAGAITVSSLPGRARQMNHGAAYATSDTLVFLHADTLLPPRFDEHIRLVLSQHNVVAGAFRLRVDTRSRSLRFIETMVNLRSQYLQMPYGDQAIFLKADTFHQIGGYPDLPVMEDYELIRKLRKLGRIYTCQGAVNTSARRWLTQGICRTTLLHQLMVIGYRLGVSPNRIIKWRDTRRPDFQQKTPTNYQDLPSSPHNQPKQKPVLEAVRKVCFWTI